MDTFEVPDIAPILSGRILRRRSGDTRHGVVPKEAGVEVTPILDKTEVKGAIPKRRGRPPKKSGVEPEPTGEKEPSPAVDEEARRVGKRKSSSVVPVDISSVAKKIKEETQQLLQNIKEENISPLKTVKQEKISPLKKVKAEKISPLKKIKQETMSPVVKVKEERMSPIRPFVGTSTEEVEVKLELIVNPGGGTKNSPFPMVYVFRSMCY